MSDEDLFEPLGNGWLTWKDFVVRHAGFPASLVNGIASPLLWEAAGQHLEGDLGREEFQGDFASAEAALSKEIQRLACDRDFREAVTWQNPRLISTCLNKAALGESRNVRGRNHEATITSYAQRYALKNDTIGFFGPVAWGKWGALDKDLLTTWEGLGTTSRSTYHEVWAVDALADALLGGESMRLHSVPRRAPASMRLGRKVRLRGSVTYLTDAERHLADAVDGRRNVGEIADEMFWSLYPELGDVEACIRSLERLEKLGVIVRGWDGKVGAHPENQLRNRLNRISDRTLRMQLTVRLEKYMKLAAAVDAAHGDADDLVVALAELSQEFTLLTGSASSRREGRNYAGRTLMYPDAQSDIRVTLGDSARELLADPLGLALDAASWLVNRAAEEYSALFDELHASLTAKTGNEQIPLPTFMNLATPHLFFSLRRLPAPVVRAQDELRSRWQLVHGAIDGGPDVVLDASEALDRFKSAFGMIKRESPPWPTAYCHSPDIMLAASPDDLRLDSPSINSRQSRFVLGELHVAVNTLESRVFVEQSAQPKRMLKASEQSSIGTRVYAVPDKGWLGVTSRLSPPSALLSPEYQYWALHDPCVETPVRCLPAEAFTVARRGAELVVVNDQGECQGALMHFLGEFLSASVANAFTVTPGWHRSPRITLGSLVIARRSWTFHAETLRWAWIRSEMERYLEARRWWADENLPSQCFYKVPIDDKPVFCDWSGIAHVNAIAKAIRQTSDENGNITLEEMLPNQDELWLLSNTGATRTCELRMVAVPDRRGLL